jgi:hypothetical protein
VVKATAASLGKLMKKCFNKGGAKGKAESAQLASASQALVAVFVDVCTVPCRAMHFCVAFVDAGVLYGT